MQKIKRGKKEQGKNNNKSKNKKQKLVNAPHDVPTSMTPQVC
jgi:hypothetical protein